MIEREKIRQLSLAIAREFKPDKIILFGSSAYGHPQDEGSNFRKT
jgi:uncharacterized protein